MALDNVPKLAMRMPFQGSDTVKAAMSAVMDDLTKSTDPRFKTCVQSHSAESVLLYVCSVLRFVSNYVS